MPLSKALVTSAGAAAVQLCRYEGRIFLCVCVLKRKARPNKKKHQFTYNIGSLFPASKKGANVLKLPVHSLGASWCSSTFFTLHCAEISHLTCSQHVNIHPLLLSALCSWKEFPCMHPHAHAWMNFSPCFSFTMIILILNTSSVPSDCLSSGQTFSTLSFFFSFSWKQISKI